MKRINLIRNVINGLILLFCLLVVAFVIFVAPPEQFSPPVALEIEEGDSLAGIADKMKEEGLIRSPLLFRGFVILLDGENSIPAGHYYFHEQVPVYLMARRISEGDYGLEPIRLTVFEGWTLFDIADHFETLFVRFDRERFFSIAEEGYLAPDTYFFSPLSSTEHLVERMRANFDSRIKALKADIDLERSIEDIVIMASILEREANTFESKRKISDILWKRIDDGMPLQVDASFVYVNNKNTYQLTLDDLQLDNPYNTYRYVGLPPTPIANPGLNALMAAADPIKNPYWYFLSDLSGNMYYGKNFDEHQYNRANYLRRY